MIVFSSLQSSSWQACNPSLGVAISEYQKLLGTIEYLFIMYEHWISIVGAVLDINNNDLVCMQIASCGKISKQQVMKIQLMIKYQGSFTCRLDFCVEFCCHMKRTLSTEKGASQ